MYEHEAVDENEAKQLTKELNAIFQKTSAKSSNGIEDLFIKIGNKFLKPKSGDNGKGQVNTLEKTKDKDNIKLNKKSGKGKSKKGCC